jgi:hypothetical protein
MSSTDLKPGYERVYTVTDYYDGPRKGIADYRGKPHLYECIFDESNSNYSESFLLAPLDTEAFRSAMEDWAIWQRWELAYHTGKTDLSTHPALQHESERHKELERILETVLVIDPAKAVTRIGHFEPIGGQTLPQGVHRPCPLQVKWTEA